MEFLNHQSKPPKTERLLQSEKMFKPRIQPTVCSSQTVLSLLVHRPRVRTQVSPRHLLPWVFMCYAGPRHPWGCELMTLRTFHGVWLTFWGSSERGQGLGEAYFMTSFLHTIPENGWHLHHSPEEVVKLLQNSGQLSWPIPFNTQLRQQCVTHMQTDGQTFSQNVPFQYQSLITLLVSHGVFNAGPTHSHALQTWGCMCVCGVGERIGVISKEVHSSLISSVQHLKNDYEVSYTYV